MNATILSILPATVNPALRIWVSKTEEKRQRPSKNPNIRSRLNSDSNSSREKMGRSFGASIRTVFCKTKRVMVS